MLGGAHLQFQLGKGEEASKKKATKWNHSLNFLAATYCDFCLAFLIQKLDKHYFAIMTPCQLVISTQENEVLSI